MKVVAVDRVSKFLERHADAEQAFSNWLDEAKQSHWRTPVDIKARYSTASFLPGNRVVFNLKGNQYRLDVLIAYETQVVIIKRLGTHQEYKKWSW